MKPLQSLIHLVGKNWIQSMSAQTNSEYDSKLNSYSWANWYVHDDQMRTAKRSRYSMMFSTVEVLGETA